MSTPPDEAYGRVTNPERYFSVQEDAYRLIDELRRQFEIADDGGPPDDPVLRDSSAEFLDVVHLSPIGEGVSPISIAFTAFPAVFVRWGRWQLSAYPGCGCDACDEDPAEVSARLRADVAAVKLGRAVEEWDGSWLWVEIAHPDGSSRGGSLREHNTEIYGKPRRYEWQAWHRSDDRQEL